MMGLKSHFLFAEIYIFYSVPSVPGLNFCYRRKTMLILHAVGDKKGKSAKDMIFLSYFFLSKKVRDKQNLARKMQRIRFNRTLKILWPLL